MKPPLTVGLFCDSCKAQTTADANTKNMERYNGVGWAFVRLVGAKCEECGSAPYRRCFTFFYVPFWAGDVYRVLWGKRGIFSSTFRARQLKEQPPLAPYRRPGFG